jgi:short-subunit dehydrogenase
MTARLVLITGASSGIGKAAARRYGSSNAHVVLLARNAGRLEEAVSAIRKDGGTATAFPVDLADARATQEVSERIAREAGTPDVLINNAGAGRWMSLLDTSLEEALAMIEVPYLAAFNLTRAFLPKMIARRSGAIACITSPASFVIWPHAVAYTAARHALAGFTEALRAEVRGSGLSITLVVLGLVESAYWEHNAGSRAHVPVISPTIAPPLTSDEAAEAIFAGVEARRRTVVKPATLRGLFMLNALAPRLVASWLRRAVPKQS